MRSNLSNSDSSPSSAVSYQPCHYRHWLSARANSRVYLAPRISLCCSWRRACRAKRTQSCSSRSVISSQRASLPVKPLAWPCSGQLWESPHWAAEAEETRDSGCGGNSGACQRHSMGLRRNNFTVWTSGANKQSFFFLKRRYNASAQILFAS